MSLIATANHTEWLKHKSQNPSKGFEIKLTNQRRISNQDFKSCDFKSFPSQPVCERFI